MPRHYQTKIWQLQIPDAWQVSAGGGQELVTLFRPDGVGMVTILTLDEQQSATIGSDRLFRSPWPDTASESHYGTSYSRAWFWSCRGRKVFVRYRCAAANAESERSQVDEIVQSISELSDSP